MWLESPYEYEEIVQALLIIEQSTVLQEQTDENILNQFIYNSFILYILNIFQIMAIFSCEFQENSNPIASSSSLELSIGSSSGCYTSPIEISLDKFLYINPIFDQDQQE